VSFPVYLILTKAHIAHEALNQNHTGESSSPNMADVSRGPMTYMIVILWNNTVSSCAAHSLFHN
jgi:hypothetical protein